ncbi:MAG: family transcriptional regulator [Herbinix sp.]|jgi:transcriptional regulator with XRE-family HTH domain|nr:family transcriptional regulator [Herbinix sp.]
MDTFKTGSLIAVLRKEMNITQRMLAEKLHVSEQAVSKWERGAGAPDISMISTLAKLLGVSPREILSGEMTSNEEDSGNMKRIKFYVCPECGNTITSTGKLELTCCGKVLEDLPIKTEEQEHTLKIDEMDGGLYLCMDHEMSKEHYISFIAYSTSDKLLINKLYPEQSAELQLRRMGHGILYYYCTNHGLFSRRV